MVISLWGDIHPCLLGSAGVWILNWGTLRVQNEQFSEEKGFILCDTEKGSIVSAGIRTPDPWLILYRNKNTKWCLHNWIPWAKITQINKVNKPYQQIPHCGIDNSHLKCHVFLDYGCCNDNIVTILSISLLLRVHLLVSHLLFASSLGSVFKILVVHMPIRTTKKVAGQPKILMQLSDGRTTINFDAPAVKLNRSHYRLPCSICRDNQKL